MMMMTKRWKQYRRRAYEERKSICGTICSIIVISFEFFAFPFKYSVLGFCHFVSPFSLLCICVIFSERPIYLSIVDTLYNCQSFPTEIQMGYQPPRLCASAQHLFIPVTHICSVRADWLLFFEGSIELDTKLRRMPKRGKKYRGWAYEERKSICGAICSIIVISFEFFAYPFKYSVLGFCHFVSPFSLLCICVIFSEHPIYLSIVNTI